MAHGRDMKNLMNRAGTFHFRGYVPKDLIHVTGKRERHRTLKTMVYAEAVHRRDAERIRHREWVDETRRRHRREYLVLNDLTDEQILDIAREFYGKQWEIALAAREEFAIKIRSDPAYKLGGYDAMHEQLRSGVVIGEDPYGLAEGFTEDILEERMVDLSSAPEARKRLQQRVVEAMAQIQLDLLGMISGYPGRGHDSSFLDPEKRLPRPPSFNPDGRPGSTGAVKHTLTELTEEFLREVRLRRRDKGYNAMASSMRLLVEFYGPDLDVRRIRRRECNQFRDFVKQLPSNYRKRYPTITDVKQIPALRRPKHDLMSYANVNKILRHLIQFLGWCEEVEAIERAPRMKNLTLRDTMPEKEKRKPFTGDQLHRIFTSPQMKVDAAEGSMFFWSYVIGLYHGLRLNEITSLDTDCIIGKGKAACIDVRTPEQARDQENPGGTKTLARIVPLHWVLVELGLPAFAASRPPGSKLFAEARVGVDGYLSRDVSDQTRVFLDSLGIEKGGPTFHSFRHCFRDAMTDVDLSQEVSAYLGGWLLKGVMNEVYGSTRMRPSLKQEIDKISYGEIDGMITGLRTSRES